MDQMTKDAPATVPASFMQDLENLKALLSARLEQGTLDEATARELANSVHKTAHSLAHALQPASGPAVSSITELTTPHGQTYIAQLCAHWGNRTTVAFDEQSGHVPLGHGTIRMLNKASTLTVTLEAPDESRLVKLQNMVGRHFDLLRYGFGEETPVSWQPVH